MGDASLVDTMMTDGLIDAFNNYHMGITGTEQFALFTSYKIFKHS